MKLQLGENQIFECESVEVEYMDGSTRRQTEDFIYVNPSSVKHISVKGIK